MSRPCRFCLAAYPILFEDGETTACEWEHRDEERIYVLARKMASVFQQPGPTDEQVAWFLADADAVVDDFDPLPEKWKLRRLPEGSSDDGFVMRFRLNDVTYVVQDGGKEREHPVRLSVLRAAQKQANEDAWRRHEEMFT